MANKLISIVLLVLLLAGCSSETKPLDLAPQEYVLWFTGQQASALTKTKQVGEMSFEYTIRPAIWAAINRDQRLSSDSIKVLAQKNKGVVCVFIKINAQDCQGDLLYYNSNSNQEASDRIAYFTAQAYEDISMNQNGNIIPCIHHIYERTYGLAKYISIVAYFKVPDNFTQSDCSIQFTDRYFGAGLVKQTFEKEVLGMIPTIKQ